jgi:hypothetical protein
MGLITKEITYDYQLNQSISEMTVTCRLKIGAKINLATLSNPYVSKMDL